MRKAQELSDPSSCMSRAKDDEMTFVLLGRDIAATAAVRTWISERLRLRKNRSDDAQIQEAEQWIKTVMQEQDSPIPSLPSVAEVTAKRFVMTLVHPSCDCSWVGKNTGFRVDLHPLAVQDVLKEIITAALALHEQREREKQSSQPVLVRDAIMGNSYSASPQLTSEQREQQRRSFAFGNANIDNPNVTRETIEKAADAATREELEQASQVKIGDTNPGTKRRNVIMDKMVGKEYSVVRTVTMPTDAGGLRLGPALQGGVSDSILPDIGKEIAEKAFRINQLYKCWSIQVGNEAIEFKNSQKQDQMVAVLASLINQGVARGAMEQWNKDRAGIEQISPQSTRESSIGALDATKPNGV